MIYILNRVLVNFAHIVHRYAYSVESITAREAVMVEKPNEVFYLIGHMHLSNLGKALVWPTLILEVVGQDKVVGTFVGENVITSYSPDKLILFKDGIKV